MIRPHRTAAASPSTVVNDYAKTNRQYFGQRSVVLRESPSAVHQDDDRTRLPELLVRQKAAVRKR